MSDTEQLASRVANRVVFRLVLIFVGLPLWIVAILLVYGFVGGKIGH